MRGTSAAGCAVALSFHPGPGRRLPWTLELVCVGETRVGVNTARTNRLAEEAIRAGRIGPLRGHRTIRREVLAWRVRSSLVEQIIDRKLPVVL